MSASITPGQKEQIVRICEDAGRAAIDAVRLDREQAQRVIRRGDELRGVVIDKIRELSVSNQFADEEVTSSYGYPRGYKLKGITYQINRLHELFPGIGYASEELVSRLTLPSGAEGWFAIPRWESVAESYNEATEKVLAALKSTRSFCNYREGQLGPEYLRQSEGTMELWQKLADQQKGQDILFVPVQFGLRHRGRSVRRVREILLVNEFGFGAYATGIMLLTHPERLSTGDELWIDCPGDEYSPAADGEFLFAPCFRFRGDGVRFVTYWTVHADERFGSVSAFLPQ